MASKDNKESKAQVKAKQIIEHRRCCEALAQRVVEEFLEDNVTERDLIEKSRYIDRLRYADVVEERSEVQRVCGYPLCNGALGPITHQKYHISLADKKVYDITQRKRYCSERCYLASSWYEKELSEAPVWARKGLPLPSVTLYTEQASTSSGKLRSQEYALDPNT